MWFFFNKFNINTDIFRNYSYETECLYVEQTSSGLYAPKHSQTAYLWASDYGHLKTTGRHDVTD